MTGKNNKYTIMLIAVLCLVYLLAGSDYGLNIYDEAIGLFGAERVSEGDMPYRDFWTIYAPGHFYLLSALMNLFGWTVLSERIISTVFLFILGLLVFITSKKINKDSEIFNYLAFISSVIWLGHTPFYSRAIPVSLIFCFLGLLL